MSQDAAPTPNTDATRAAIEAFFVGEYESLVERVRKAIGGSEPERWVNEAAVAAFTRLEELEEADLVRHEKLRERWTSQGKVVKFAKNRFKDAWRRAHTQTSRDPVTGKPIRTPREFPVDPQPEDPGHVPETVSVPVLVDHPDKVAPHLVATTRRRAVATVLRVLVQRGMDARRGATSLNPTEWATLQALATIREVEQVAEAPLSDQELHELVKDRNRRARERWAAVVTSLRAGRGWPSLHTGDAAAVADELHVNRATISRRLAGVRRTLMLTRYVAGVLAPEHALLDARRVRRHLDAFDELGRSASDHQDLLRNGAPLVRTTENTGTRVDRAAYDSVTFGAIEELHHAETAFAAATGTPHPNCVTICDAHNPTRNRATEI